MKRTPTSDIWRRYVARCYVLPPTHEKGAENVGSMTDPEAQATKRSASPTQPIKSSSISPFLGALIGAIVGGLIVSAWSNFLTLRDQHVREADKCRGLVSSLLTTAALAREVAQSAASSIAAPIPANRASNKFALPPYDEMIHSQDQSLDILDPRSIEAVLRVEAYYQAVRDDLSNTPSIYHTGETYGVPPSSGNKDAYEGLLNLLARQADGAIRALRSSGPDYCDTLANTSLWPSVRRGDSASDQ